MNIYNTNIHSQVINAKCLRSVDGMTEGKVEQEQQKFNILEKSLNVTNTIKSPRKYVDEYKNIIYHSPYPYIYPSSIFMNGKTFS